MDHKRVIFPSLYGNARFSSIVASDILSDRLGHAFILEGPRGSGKHTAVHAVAAALSCENRNSEKESLPCGRCLFCRKIKEGVSPDVLFFGREDGRATIGVETIRRLREDLYIVPNENEKKVYVVEDADTMTVQAQNALLLSLEDPPPYVVFFLLTENAASLLETIRSRAPVLRMEFFPPEKMAQILKNESRFETLSRTDPTFFAEAIAAAGGALGQARLLLSRNDPDSASALALRADALRFVSLLFSSGALAASELLYSLPKAREDVLRLLELVTTALRDLIAVKKNADTPLLLYARLDDCRAISDKISVGRILTAYDSVREAHADIRANASVQTVCTALLMKKH